ncbi:MAG TPA: hypothetical protein VFR02_10195, partial [bacterium]|nr:hypothetical protein [bacterium]
MSQKVDRLAEAGRILIGLGGGVSHVEQGGVAGLVERSGKWAGTGRDHDAAALQQHQGGLIGEGAVGLLTLGDQGKRVKIEAGSGGQKGERRVEEGIVEGGFADVGVLDEVEDGFELRLSAGAAMAYVRGRKGTDEVGFDAFFRVVRDPVGGSVGGQIRRWEGDADDLLEDRNQIRPSLLLPLLVGWQGARFIEGDGL